MDNDRQKYNREILRTVSNFMELHPEMRFQQILWALNIIEKDTDKFYEEPDITLKKLQRRLKELKQ